MLKNLAVGTTVLLSSSILLVEEYWIDVRIPEQYQEQHVEGAINIPLAQLQDKIVETVKNKDDIIHVYCNTGNQSDVAAIQLKAMNYTNVINEGGVKTALVERIAKQ